MPAQRIPMFGVGLRGRSAAVTAQYRVNAYADVQAAEDRTKIVFYGTPGLRLFCSLGDSPIRGHISVEVLSLDYVVHRGTLYSVDNAGTATALGALSTTDGRVDMTWTGQYVFIVDDTFAYTWDTVAESFAIVNDSDFPNGASTCTWIDGYVVVEDGDEFQLSDLDAPRDYDASFRASAESIPDSIVRVLNYRGQLILFGPQNTEFWGNTGALDFPLARVGSGVINVGLVAKWSPAQGANAVFFLGQTMSGGVGLYSIGDGGLQKVSQAEWDSVVNQYSNKADATGLCYSHSGHEFYQVNFPSAGKSWLFDATTGLFSELRSSGGRHRAEIASNFINSPMVSDYASGKLYRMDPDVYEDNGATMEFELVSRHLFMHDFSTMAEFWADFDTGHGTVSGQGSNPQVMLSVSKDGGRTWGPERWTGLGAAGEYGRRAVWRRLGRSRDWTLKLRITDPVKRALMGEGWADGA